MAGPPFRGQGRTLDHYKAPKMSKALIIAAVASVLAGGPALAFNRPAADYNPQASAQAAKSWRLEANAMAPQVSTSAALNPAGPTLIASRPVPDTPANRAKYGEPMSRAGQRTAPIGD